MRSRSSFPVRPFDRPPIQVVEAVKLLFVRSHAVGGQLGVRANESLRPDCDFDERIWLP